MPSVRARGKALHGDCGGARHRDRNVGRVDGSLRACGGTYGRSRSLGTRTGIIVTAGFAEIAAGSIAMGLGGYLAAKTDTEHYASELDREYRETVELAGNGKRRSRESFSRLRTHRTADAANRQRDHGGSEKVGRLHDAV